MSNTSLNESSFGMKLVLAGIKAKFSDVKQLSTDEYFEIWSSNCIPKTPSVSTSSEISTSNCITFDVRGEEERDISYIKNSVWIDSRKDSQSQLNDIKQVLCTKIDELKLFDSKVNVDNVTISKKDLTVVAYCSVGYRSSELINQIQKSDIIKCVPSYINLNLYNLEGSLFKWANEKKPLVDSNDIATSFVHPYNVMWGQLLEEDLRKWSK